MVDLSALNAAQRAAVVYNAGPALVIASAGSGKTRVITYKLAHLVELGCDPQRLYALTFTNKAAGEMRSRVSQMLGEEVAYRLHMGTFHSICGRILRKYAPLLGYTREYSIYDTSDTKALIRNCIKELDLSDKSYAPARVLKRISDAKNMLISPQAYASNQEIRQYDTLNHEGDLYKLYNLYTQRCKESDSMDFDDLLYQLNVLIRDFSQAYSEIKASIDYLLIDEYQDTNTSQFELTRRLVSDHNHIFAVGDDAQSIYSFRGARIANILSFKQAFPGAKLFKLEQNYRSTGHIVSCANTLIEHNQQRIPKEVYTDLGDGEKLRLYHYTSSDDEASLLIKMIAQRRDNNRIPLSDQAILYRTNAQSRKFEELLISQGIPYVIYGGVAFYSRAEVKDVMAYLQIIANPHNEIALRRAIAYPRKGIGDKTLEKVALYAQQQIPKLSLYDALCAVMDSSHPLDMSKSVRNKIASFVNLIDSLSSACKHYAKLEEWIAHILRESGIVAELTREDTVESQAKLENLKEFVSSASEFEVRYRKDPLNLFADEPLGLHTLGAFVQQIPLLTNQDQDSSDLQAPHLSKDRLQLMTIHAAKGLEFPYVYIAGVEDSILPSSRSFDTTDMIEEERRLLYVGITRAKSLCTISYTNIRTRNGKTELMIPSRFIKELPKGHYVLYDEASPVGTAFYAPLANTLSDQSNRVSTTTPRREEDKQALLAKSSPVNALETLEGYKVGDRVEHPRHGMGSIKHIDSTMGGKLTVLFDDGKTREVLIRYTTLDKLDSWGT